ncbi:hypothetical protein D1122_20890 [Cereibacter sphaeroides]|uniref:restriction endonuclease subunit S n=1 Tax=Cereibacter sphaeroides TaxID=1063 RepID=UPI000E5B3E02|nr:restriction endonuclease subunit S [Cereibacter sphaeroides]RHZ91689.1 hypothetical protein D1122_20890 [Cereibacter sphaeroides]
MMEVFRFKNLGRWDKFTIPHLHFPTHVPSEQIGRLLKPREERVDRTQYRFEDLQPITIHFGGDISRRKVAPGREYTLPLLWVRPGDVVLSKIDLKNGAVGVLEDGWDNAVVTTHFKVYEPDLTRLDPTYFRMLLQTGEFKRWLWANRSGADGRTEVKLDVFEELEIPLPPLPEQQAIVAAWRAAGTHAAALEREAAETEAKAALAFESALGVSAPSPLPERKILVAQFKDLERWSHDAILRRQHPDVRPPPTYPMVSLSTVGDVAYGMQKHPGNRPGKNSKPYLRVANVQRGRLVLDEIKYIDISGADFERIRLEDRDLLFVEGNGSRENLGRVALWLDQIPDCVHQNHLIRARMDKAKVLPEFAAYWFNSGAGRAHFFEEGKTTSGLGTINSSVVKSAPIPVPPMDVQQKLAQQYDEALATAEKQREDAAKARAKAWTDFETAVYAAEVVEEAAAQIAAAS